MIEKLKTLESISRKLEPALEERRAMQEAVNAYTESFLENLPRSKTFKSYSPDVLSHINFPITEEGVPIEEAIQCLQGSLDRFGLNPASGGHMGYIPGGGIYPSAFGDFIADVFNHYAGYLFVGPGAVRMENELLQWMAKIIGYPSSSAGNLTSGGSMANLIGLTTARDALGLKSKDFSKAVVYLTEEAHHSLTKALRIIGLGESIQRIIPTDPEWRMDTSLLEKTIREDKKEGLIPAIVIASAGTTNTGTVDPIPKIADIAQKYALWLHVDAAYGGFFILTPEGEKRLRGVERSDSIVMDPHKGLFLPYGTGAILVKNRDLLFQSHRYSARYLQDLKQGEELSPADLSPELTKHFRGLRFWLPLKVFGLAPFRAALEEKIDLARYFYEKIRTVPGFEVGPFPDLSVLVFRYLPKQGDADLFNEKLIQAIQQEGRIFLSATRLHQKFYIRLAVLSFRTHLETIELALEILKEKVRMLES